MSEQDNQTLGAQAQLKQLREALQQELIQVNLDRQAVDLRQGSLECQAQLMALQMQEVALLRVVQFLDAEEPAEPEVTWADQDEG